MSYLSTSQVAKLLNTSVYNIHYYEKEGLLPPPKRTEKGYRLFSYDDIETLCSIMMLRSSEIPIKDIKDLASNYTPDKFKEKMKESSNNLEAEIMRLQSLKANIDKVLDEQAWTNLGFFSRPYPSRYFLKLTRTSYDHQVDEKEFYQLIMKQNVMFDMLYKSNILCLLEKENVTYFIEHVNGEHLLEAGDYLCYRFRISEESEFEREVFNFFEYTKRNNLLIQGPLYGRELNVEAYYYDNHQVYELQILLRP